MSYLSDFEHTKLDAHVQPGIVVQTHYISDLIAGKRRVPKTKVWKVMDILGKGGFGEVRLEVCPEENEQRAVKRIWATGSAFKIQYERELKALLEFSKPKYKESAAFVEFFGWFEDLESVYLAMEYLPFGDLEQNIVACGGAVNESEVREITVQILEGLKIMHLENFVHRDLKPKNILVCQKSPHWWVKLADFGLSKRRTEETECRTQTGTQAYMAPEILNYVPGINPETSEYTNAVDIWALGCIVYRLASGVVPFPPGPSLGTFCRDESTFPSKGLALSELGSTFVRNLLVSQPSRRLAAQQALDHVWIRAVSEASGLNAKHSECRRNDSTTAFELSFGQYNTATHAGLRSQEASHTIQVRGHSDAEREQPKMSYRSPTVEDEDEQSDAIELRDEIALDQYQEQSPTDTTRSSRPDIQSPPGEVESPEITARDSLKSSMTVAPQKLGIRRGEREQIAKNAAMEDYQTLKPPHVKRSKNVPSRVVRHLSTPLRTRNEKGGRHGQGEDRRSNEADSGRLVSSDYDSDSQRSSGGSSWISFDSRPESPIHHSRRLSRSPTPPQTTSKYVYRDGEVLAVFPEFEPPTHSSRRLSKNTPRRREQTRYVYQDGKTVPVPSSINSWDSQDSKNFPPRDRSKSPSPTSTRYHLDSNRNPSRTVPQFYGEVKYAPGFTNVDLRKTTTINPLNTRKPSSDARAYYPRRPSTGRDKVFYDHEDDSTIRQIIPLTQKNLNKYIPDFSHMAHWNLATPGAVSRPSVRSRSVIVNHGHKDNSEYDDERHASATLLDKTPRKSRKARRARDLRVGDPPSEAAIKTVSRDGQTNRIQTWRNDVSRSIC